MSPKLVACKAIGSWHASMMGAVTSASKGTKSSHRVEAGTPRIANGLYSAHGPDGEVALDTDRPTCASMNSSLGSLIRLFTSARVIQLLVHPHA